jgi:hypothetical protein
MVNIFMSHLPEGFYSVCHVKRFPLWHKLVHISGKAIIVVAFQQIHQFMNDDVLQVLNGLLRHFQIEPDPSRFDFAASPTGFSSS